MLFHVFSFFVCVLLLFGDSLIHDPDLSGYDVHWRGADSGRKVLFLLPIPILAHCIHFVNIFLT